MARIPLRFLLIVLLCIEVILWSRSQQAGVDLQRTSLSTIGFWKRAVAGEPFEDAVKGKCLPRALPLNEQCAHVQHSCPKSKTLLGITYVEKYFCSPAAVRTGYFMALTLWLVFLFSTLGISASDFFCPNLATISIILGLDENVAGVTFLALGNGSPDVFSTFSAMKANSGGLAIGELIGAASFIVSVVVGSMALIKPFQVHKWPFLRDVGFFTIAIAVLLGVLMDGIIKDWEAGVLVLLYACYVTVVVVGSWREKRAESRRAREMALRSQYADDDAVGPAVTSLYRDDPEEDDRDDATDDTISVSPTSPISPQSRLRALSNPTAPRTESFHHRPLSLHIPTQASEPHPSPTSHTPSRPGGRQRSYSSNLQQLPSYSLLGALEFRTAVNLLRQSSNASLNNALDASPITPYAAGHYHSNLTGHHHRSRSAGTEREIEEGDSNPWEASLEAVPLDERHHSVNLGRHESSQSLHPHARLHSMSPSRSSLQSVEEEGEIASPTASVPLSAIPEINILRPSKRQRAKSAIVRAWHTLFPTLHHFTEKSVLGMVAALFAVPAVFCLTITLPVVVTPREENEVVEPGKHVEAAEANVPQLGNLIDFEEDGAERPLIAEEEVEEELRELDFNKWLMATQCICGPLFCVAVLFSASPNFTLFTAVTAILGSVVAVLVAIFADKGNDPAARVARASMGFLVAIVWIMAIADEVVQVLQTFGLIFGLSDAIIGLTIFAVGNSLADFVANITVAAFAPIMGFSACFGGPMLNILLGVGLSGTYIIRQTGEPYLLHLSTTLLVSSIGLLALLMATIVVVPWNGYWINRPWAMVLIMFYVVVMVVNVVVEVKNEQNS